MDKKHILIIMFLIIALSIILTFSTGNKKKEIVKSSEHAGLSLKETEKEIYNYVVLADHIKKQYPLNTMTVIDLAWLLHDIHGWCKTYDFLVLL